MQRFRSRALIVFLFALILVLMAGVGRFASAATGVKPEARPALGETTKDW
ncbi:MAG: hypothetical protein ACRDYA_05210 [Egibacteraceae bacterium]